MYQYLFHDLAYEQAIMGSRTSYGVDGQSRMGSHDPRWLVTIIFMIFGPDKRNFD